MGRQTGPRQAGYGVPGSLLGAYSQCTTHAGRGPARGRLGSMPSAPGGGRRPRWALTYKAEGP